MAHELDIEHIASRISDGDSISLGVDSIIVDNKVVYNLSVVVRVQKTKVALIWTKDIEDDITDELYRDMYELNLLSSLYKNLYYCIKQNDVSFSVKIHKNWFNRFKYEPRNTKLKIDKL
jgi:hypothetical protein